METPGLYLFLDTETTGLPARYNAPASDVRSWPRMVQVAWVLADAQGNELASHCHIIRPDGFVIPADAVRVHGITTEIARLHGVDVHLALDEISADLPSASLLIGHNIDFDYGVVGAEFFRAGRTRNPLDGLQRYCTMKTTADLCRIPGSGYGFKWPKLDELHYTLFRKELRAGHEALADARACMRCYFELLRRASAEHQAVELDGDGPASSLADPLEEDQDDEAGQLFDDIYAMAEDQDWFDTEFVDSVYDQYEETGRVTERQRLALERIRDMLEERAR